MDPRSQRQPQQQSRRPPYPQVTTQSAPTSPSSSVFQSSSSISSVNTTASRQQPPMIQTRQPDPISAPLPSPSSIQPANHYFGSLAQQSATSHPSQQQPRQQQGQSQYVGQRGGGGAAETQPFLKDFNLVAEAAKRAQMACLARDFGEVGL